MSERSEIVADSVGLGFSVLAGRVSVHYPRRLPDGSMAFGAGFDVDFPFGHPSNCITEERTSLIRSLLGVSREPDMSVAREGTLAAVPVVSIFNPSQVAPSGED